MIVGTFWLFVACSVAKPPAEAPSPREQPTPAPGRIVAVGDLHADLNSARQVFQLAGLIDGNDQWIGGDTTLVQTGDLTDRGPDSKEVVELMMSLDQDAKAAGGTVIPLLGNHEVMNLQGDWRYVTPEDVSDWGSKQARAQDFQTGPIGSWLRQRDVVAKVGHTVFVHGGISAGWSKVPLDVLSAQARAALNRLGPDDVLGSQGPLWYRGYVQNPEQSACAELEVALTNLGAKRMVVGHTTQRSGQILPRCGGQLLAIDTGISPHYGAHLAALELREGDAWAIYPSGAVDLPDPKVSPTGVGKPAPSVKVGP